MNRKLKWLAVAAGLILLLIAIAPWTVSGTALRAQLAEQVFQQTGLVAHLEGRTTLALLPRPRIKIEGVTIGDAGGKVMIKAGTLRGDLRLWPVIGARMEVSSISFSSPQVEIDLDGQPLPNESAIARVRDTAPSSAQAKREDATRLATIHLNDATLRLRRGQDLIAQLDDVSSTLEWSSLGNPAGLRASFIMRGEPVDFSAWLGQPARFLRGEASPLSLRLDSHSLKLSANGIVTGGASPTYTGKITTSSPSLRRLLARYGYEMPLPIEGALNLSADAQANPRSLQLSDLQFKLDASTFEGALIVSTHKGRPAIMGTLATRLLDLNPALRDIEIEPDSEGRWSNNVLPPRTLGHADIDLRVSANRAALGRVNLRDAAFSIQSTSSKQEVAIAEARAYGGTLKARFIASPNESGYDFRTTAAFTDVDSGPFFNDLLRSNRMNGKLSGDFSIAGDGASLGQIMRRLQGQARFELLNGDIGGLDLEQALRRLEKRPLSIASEIRTGRTSVTKAELQLNIEQGVARIKNFQAIGPGLIFDVSGAASIGRRSLDLSIRASQSGRENVEQAPQLSLGLTGNWDDPHLQIDARSLIRRSQAAQPLLRKENAQSNEAQ